MEASAISLREQTDPLRIEAQVKFAGADPVDLFIEGNVPLRQTSAVWLSVALPMAMKVGAPLRVDAPMDVKLHNGLLELQAKFAEWWPNQFASIGVDASSFLTERVGGEGVGCFFSGGVDSFYSAVQNRRLTHTIFVHGFDISLANQGMAARAAAELRQASLSLDLSLVEIRTNIRDLGDQHLDWGAHLHGAAIAAVGHALAEHTSTLLIPSSYNVHDLIKWGTHPELDHLWSSSAVRFVHDGAEATRTDKIARLADFSVAMNHLRVCWLNPQGEYNCGKCEKCIRTMLSLFAAGALGRCRTLPHRLSVRDVWRLPIRHGSDRFAAENLVALRGQPGGRLYATALRGAIARGRWRVFGSSVKRRLTRQRNK